MRPGCARHLKRCGTTPACPWFEFNAFRHTGATRFAEAGLQPYLLERRMGHVGAKMMRRYVQIGQQAERLAIRNTVERKPVLSIEQEQLRRRMGNIA